MTEIRFVIVAKPYPGHPPIGTVIGYMGPEREYWAKLDGRTVSRDDYPELFKVIGNTYWPPQIRRQDRWSRLLRWLRIADRTMPNPAYDPDTFRIPDLRGHFIR